MSIKNFKNELKNKIQIEVADCYEGVVINLVGPHSDVQNIITKKEARKLRDALNEYFETR
jgi:hypothetical protein